MSEFLLHSPPVHLGASLLQFELKTRNLQDAEEAVSHHTGDGIVDIKKALSKPGERKSQGQATVQPKLMHTEWVNGLGCYLILSTLFG